MQINIYCVDEPNLLYLIRFLQIFVAWDNPISESHYNSEHNVS